MSTRDLIEQVCTLRAFGAVLESMRAADAATAENIKSTLHATLGTLPATMADATAAAHEKLIAVKDAKLRLMEYRLHYETIAEQMARQKEYFLRTAIDTSSAFFDEVYNALDAYFTGMGDKVAEFLCDNSSWLTGLVDTWRKTGGVAINKAKTAGQNTLTNATDPRRVDALIKRTGNVLGERGKKVLQQLANAAGKMHAKLAGTDANATVVEERILLDKALNDVCPNEEIEKQVAHIFEQAAARYQATWKKRVVAYNQEVAQLDGAARAAVGALTATPEFTLGMAEQTLAASFSATIFGTAALAAGWHTLTYAMMNVFWPLTVFVVMLTSGVAWFTRDKAREQRIAEARKILNAYHAQLLLFIDTKPLAEDSVKSIRQLVNEQSLTVANEQDAAWTQARFGSLAQRHYAALAKAIQQQFTLLNALEGG